jgi:uncharacterized repeat protein (TIGR01451 family)
MKSICIVPLVLIFMPALAAQTANLSITETAAPNPVPAGAILTYTLTVANAGPDTALNVAVTAGLSAAFTPVSCSTNGGVACNALNTGANFASLAANTSVTVTIGGSLPRGVPNGTTITTTASVSSSTPDPDPGNNSAMNTVTVGMLPTTILAFGNEALHQLSAPQYVALTSGAASLNISGISSNSTEFQQKNSCPVGGVLAAGATCAIEVRFDPDVTGPRSGAITVSGNGSSNPRIIALNGVGVASKLDLSTRSMTFEPIMVGTRTGARVVRLTNHGGALHITGLVIQGGDFVRTTSDDSCPLTGAIEAGESCTIGIAFTPRGSGVRRGTVLLTDDDPASPQSIGLEGAGKAVRLSENQVSFGGVIVALSSAPRIETVTILGDTAVTFSPATPGGANPGDFMLKQDTCSGNTLPGGATCRVFLTFTPTAAGDRDAKLTLADSDPGSPQGIQLSGTGIQPVVTGITISPLNPGIGTGDTLQLRATASYSNGSTKDVTALARWDSSNPGAVRVSNAAVTKGLADGVTPGKSSITATLGDDAGHDTVTTFIVPHLSFSRQPATTSVSAAIAPGVRVLVLDHNNAPIAGQSLSMSLGPNPPKPAALTGTLTQITNATGTATFSDLKLDYLGKGYTLVATAITPGGPYTATSTPFNENRVGDPCLGPELPACSSSCPDTDGDGLNDAWEKAGGIDINGDGLITAKYDLLLPGADPNKQDVYVQYDWMDYATPGNACSADSDCAAISGGHAFETCSGPKVLPTASGSCRFACTADSDCASRGNGHHNDKCQANSCVHTHDPDLSAPGALQEVVDSFAAHGINLHLLRGHALPHSLVTSFRLKSEMSSECEGATLADGSVGIGKYAESLYDLKAVSSMDPLKIAYHYGLFSHYSGCDTAAHCFTCPVSHNPDGSIKNQPSVGQSGLAELSGNDFLVSLGGRFQDFGHDPGVFDVGTTFMHELGHNLGLRHGGGIDTPCKTAGAACPGGGVCTQTLFGNLCFQGEDINAKPNFLSVMNYRYQFTGIIVAKAAGFTSPIACATNLDCPFGTLCNHGSCSRLDYSNQVLPTGGNTPGYLDQSTVPDSPAAGDPGLGLSEPAGLGSGVADLFTFTDARETGIPKTAASQGPVDWDGDGAFTNVHVQADTICGPIGFGDHPCTARGYGRLNGHMDWGPAGQNHFTYQFQCTSYGGPSGDGASSLTPLLQYEPNTQMFADSHFLYPPREATAIVETDCTPAKTSLATVPRRHVRVVLLGRKDFDVTEIEPSSLLFHGAKPISVSFADVDGDGLMDVTMLFERNAARLARDASRGHIQGWLKNSQVFSGEDLIELGACR